MVSQLNYFSHKYTAKLSTNELVENRQNVITKQYENLFTSSLWIINQQKIQYNFRNGVFALELRSFINNDVRNWLLIFCFPCPFSDLFQSTFHSFYLDSVICVQNLAYRNAGRVVANRVVLLHILWWCRIYSLRIFYGFLSWNKHVLAWTDESRYGKRQRLYAICSMRWHSTSRIIETMLIWLHLDIQGKSGWFLTACTVILWFGGTRLIKRFPWAAKQRSLRLKMCLSEEREWICIFWDAPIPEAPVCYLRPIGTK